MAERVGVRARRRPRPRAPPPCTWPWSAWGVGPGDVVPVSTLTFAATVNAIRYVGAEPHFVDCDQATGNMSPSAPGARHSGQLATARAGRVPVVIPVDMLGKCVDYDAIDGRSRKPRGPVLSDAAESVGASYGGGPPARSATRPSLSFNGNKIMTTSGGGMLLTDDAALAAHVRKLSTQAREPVLHYEHTEIGYNYRLSNVLAALGRAQLARLDEMMAPAPRLARALPQPVRRAVAGVEVLGGRDDAEDNCWLTAVLVDPAVSPWSVDELAATLVDPSGSRPARCGSRCTSSPSSPAADATLDGSADRAVRDGLDPPRGSGMTEDQFARVEEASAR